MKFLAFLLLLMLLPVIVFVFLLLLIVYRSSPLFFQKRSGYRGMIFEIIKFKTFINGKITKIGKVIRILNLDELPQLINVLLGNMAFIGPRPLLPSYDKHLSLFEKQRQDVLPGITGLAQVRGGKNLSWEHQFRYDVFYVKNKSILLDLLILRQTVLHFFKYDESKINEIRTWNRY